MGLMAIPCVVLESPPKTRLGLPKKTVPGPLEVAVPVMPDPKAYAKDVLLVTEMAKTPLRLRVAGVPPLEFVSGGTPEIRTVVGIPGTKPVRGAELAGLGLPARRFFARGPWATEVRGRVKA